MSAVSSRCGRGGGITVVLGGSLFPPAARRGACIDTSEPAPSLGFSESPGLMFTSTCKGCGSVLASGAELFPTPAPSPTRIGYPSVNRFIILVTAALSLLLTEKKFSTLGCIRTARDFFVFPFSSLHFEVLEPPRGCNVFVSATGLSVDCSSMPVEFDSRSRRLLSSR